MKCLVLLTAILTTSLLASCQLFMPSPTASIQTETVVINVYESGIQTTMGSTPPPQPPPVVGGVDLPTFPPGPFEPQLVVPVVEPRCGKFIMPVLRPLPPMPMATQGDLDDDDLVRRQLAHYIVELRNHNRALIKTFTDAHRTYVDSCKILH